MNIITDRNEIEQYANKIAEVLCNTANYQKIANVKVVIVHGTGIAPILYYLPELNLWFCTRKIEDSYDENGNYQRGRWWNSFGFGPIENSSVKGLLEINVPLEKTSSHIQGAFIEDSGKIYLVHRGTRIAGIPNKSFIHSNYQGERKHINTTSYLLVGEITSANFLTQLQTFITEIQRIKDLYKSTPVN